MAQVLVQPALQRIISTGIAEIKADTSKLDKIFEFYLCNELLTDYGQTYIDNIKTWFAEIKIPVNQGWSFNTTIIPSISLTLASESEDESKAALGDFHGFGEDGERGISVFNVQLDIGIHGSKNGDEVIWLYHIVSYILFTKKQIAESFGMMLQTFQASDYNRDSQYLADNIWSRWIRFRCTVTNFWDGAEFLEFDDLTTDVDAINIDGDVTDL